MSPVALPTRSTRSRLGGEVAHAIVMHFRALVVGAPGERDGRANGARRPSWKNALPAARASPSISTVSLPPARGLAADRSGVGRRGGSASSRPKGPSGCRRLAVVLLEPRAHLAHELTLQGEGRREDCFGIGVLGLRARECLQAAPRILQHSRQLSARIQA